MRARRVDPHGMLLRECKVMHLGDDGLTEVDQMGNAEGGLMSDAPKDLDPVRARGFKSYPAYKDSGVEWLGEIPTHWEVRRLKTIAAVQLSNVDKKSIQGQESVRLCNYVDVYYNERITDHL